MIKIKKTAYFCLFYILIFTFTLPSVYCQDVPEISIPEAIWDIGTLKLNEEATHSFKITNTGSQPLEITQLRSSCGCLQVEITSNIIQPNESAEIKAIFKEDQRLGDVIKTIYIDSNDPGTPRTTIKVKANLVKDESTPPLEAPKKPLAEVKENITKNVSVGILLFYSEDCSDCRGLKENILPRLSKKFGDTLKKKSYSIDIMDNYDLLVKFEKQFGDMGNDTPVVFIGKDVLGGKESSIRLEGLIEKYISQGGSDFPTLAITNAEKTTSISDKIIYVAYFQRSGCKVCDRVNYILRSVENSYTNLQIKKFDSEEKENTELFEALCNIYNVPEKQRLVAPAIFIGDQYLIQESITDESLRGLINKYAVEGTSCPWERAAEMRSGARNEIIRRFRSLGAFAIIMAGLIDGINPCAFATIVLFMSYLALIGRKGRELIYVGSAFTISVFLTYFLVGLGVFRFIQTLSIFSLFSKILYIFIAALAFILGSLSFYDFIKAKQGKTRDMYLQLPKFLKDRIHKTIRGRAKTKRFVIAAFVTGAIISLLELACTGQVYLPTLCFVVGVPELRNNAIFYLLLYNLMFILPLAIIFILTYFGTTFTSLAGVLQRRLALIKLLTSILFFGLCGLLISNLI